METDELREKAKLLLQRERELFDMRAKHDQLTGWLSLGQSLPALFSSPAAPTAELCEALRRMFFTKLRVQRVLILQIREGELHPLAPAGDARPLSPEGSALLEREPFGLCNEPAESALVALAQALKLHRFMWSRIELRGGDRLLMAVGYDQSKARFQSPFVKGDAAQFANATQHVQSLMANALLVSELQRERDHLKASNLALKERDEELEIATEQLRAANESLERRVQERTQELAGRNRDLRVVLDSVDQALMTIDLHGRLASERSRMAERWFGADSGAEHFAAYTGADERFTEQLGIGLEFLRDGLMPREACIDHLPKRLAVRDRHFECRYLPVGDEQQVAQLLVVVDDITERLARSQEEMEQRELLAAFQGFTRDRRGFVVFFGEAERMLGELRERQSDPSAAKHLLHTLKGNASTFGLQALAGLCHLAEGELTEHGHVPDLALERIHARWKSMARALTAVGFRGLQGGVELTEHDLAELAQRAREGASADEVLAMLGRLRWELVERSLSRLAQHATALAQRLGKGELEVVIEADAVRLDPERWGALWASLVHLVRNAVDHGLEAPARRMEAGKPASARLRLAASRAAGQLKIEIADDGRGIDWESVRCLCESRGLASDSRSDLVEALLASDFSTRREVTEISGRGVGLSVVARCVAELGGSLTVHSEPREGTRWVLAFPWERAAAPSSSSPGALASLTTQAC